MISNNNELYSLIRNLANELQLRNEIKWSDALLQALSISTLPGEILGEIRLNLRRLKATDIMSRLQCERQVEDALQYLDTMLG